MMTEKTKKVLFWTLIIVGFTLLFGALICEIISEHSDALPESDMYRALMLLGWPIGLMSIYFEPITTRNLENGAGCFLAFNIFFLICLPVTWIFEIEHFTAPIVVILVISAILTIVDIVLAYKKSQQIKARIGEEEKKQEEKKQE